MNLDDILALYQASNKRVPALKMEDHYGAEQGTSSRGNSHFDKFASPDTREKVLQARLQEIEHYAKSRNLPVATVFAIAEAAMRTGKVPDLGQYGLAGDDAVATKHFILGNVLNLQVDDEQPTALPLDEAGMQKLARRGEMTVTTQDYKGKLETLPGARPRSKQAVFRRESSDQRAMARGYTSPEHAKNIAARNAARSKPYNEALVSALSGFMVENKDKGRLAETFLPTTGSPTLAYGGMNTAAPSKAALPEKQDTEKVDLLPKAIMQKLRELKGVDVTGFSQADLVKLARDRGLLGTDESVSGAVPAEAGDTTVRADNDMVYLLTASARGRTLAGASMVDPAPIELNAAEDKRSEADKLLGIAAGDPRAESWPKLSPELARLMNLEDNRYLAPKPGMRIPDAPKAQVEATTMGSVGGLMTAGASLLNQSVPRPSYDTSQDLPTSKARRKQILADILKKHGLRPE